MKNTKNSNLEDKQKKLLRIQRILSVSVIAVFTAVILYFYIKYGKKFFGFLENPESLQAYLSKFKGYDKLVFVGIRAFQTVIKVIPAEPLEIGSGFLYGTWGGMALCLAGSMIGSVVIILLTKLFGRRIVDLFVSVDKINSMGFLQNKRRVYVTLFFIYLIPGTPKDVLTYVASITDINMPLFLLITGIARIPSIVTSTVCGEQIINKNYTLAILIFALTGICAVISSVIYKKVSGKKNSEGEI